MKVSPPKLDCTEWLPKPVAAANISTIYAGDVSSMLGVVDDESVDLVVTSPPYAETTKESIWRYPRRQIRRVVPAYFRRASARAQAHGIVRPEHQGGHARGRAPDIRVRVGARIAQAGMAVH